MSGDVLNEPGAGPEIHLRWPRSSGHPGSRPSIKAESARLRDLHERRRNKHCREPLDAAIGLVVGEAGVDYRAVLVW